MWWENPTVQLVYMVGTNPNLYSRTAVLAAQRRAGNGSGGAPQTRKNETRAACAIELELSVDDDDNVCVGKCAGWGCGQGFVCPCNLFWTEGNQNNNSSNRRMKQTMSVVWPTQ